MDLGKPPAGLGSLAPSHPGPRNLDSAAGDAELRRWLCAAGPEAPSCSPPSPWALALTAQLVSDATRELLGHLTPGSSCKERQAEGRGGRKRRADRRTCEISFYVNNDKKPGVQEGATQGSAPQAGAEGVREPGNPSRLSAF